MFSPTKTMCVHFCQLQKLLLDPELYLDGTQIPIIGETKFLGLFDSKLSFIPHKLQLASEVPSRARESSAPASLKDQSCHLPYSTIT